MAISGLKNSLNNLTWQRLQRPLRWLGYVVAALLVLAAISWLALPSYIKKVAIAQTQEKIGRKLELGEISFNPFRLSLTVSGITLYEADQKTPFFTANGLLVNASSASIFRLAPVLDEIKLDTPSAHIVRTSAEGIGQYNFSDILQRIDAMPKSEGKTLFSLANVQLQNGSVRFEDKVTGKNVDLKALQIGLPFLSNLPGSVDSFIQPHLSATINGAPFSLQGRSKPFTPSLESAFVLDIDKLDLVSYLPFIPASLPVNIESAKLSTQLELGFSRTDEQPKVILGGDIALDDFSLQDKNRAPLLKAKNASVKLKQFDVLNASGSIDQITLDAPKVWASLNAKGDINWVTTFASDKPRTPAPATVNTNDKPDTAVTTKTTPAPADKKNTEAILIQKLVVRDGEINWRDEANAKPAQSVQLSKVAIDAEQVSTAADAPPSSVKISLVENGHGNLKFDGTIAPMKAAVNGKVTLEAIDVGGYQNYLNGSLAATAAGKLSGAGDVRLDNGQFNVDGLGLELADMKLTPKAKGAEAVAIKSIALQKASLDLANRKAQADAIRISGLNAHLRRESDGSFNLQQLVAASDTKTNPQGKAATSSQATAPATRKAPQKSTTPEWQAQLATFSLADSTLNFEDANAGSKTKLDIRGINLQLQNLSSRLDQISKFKLQATFDKNGKLDISGQSAPKLSNIDLTVDARSIPVAPFQGYFASVLNVTLATGLLNANGKLAVTPPLDGRAFALTYQGNAAVNNLRMQDKVTSTDFLRWRTLNLNGIQAKIGGRPQVSLDKVTLANFYARAILSEKGRLNLQDILVSDAQSAGSITDPDGKESGKDKPAAEKDKPSTTVRKTTTSNEPVTPPAADPNAPIIRVAQIVFESGNVNYTDNFVNPNYSANMTGLSGSIGAIASDNAQPAPVNLSGKIDNDAPLQISGSLNPLFKPMFLDIKASANGVQLPRLTPYSAKYAGYPITKGKLSMDVQYKIEQDKLVAQNSVRIEQLTFGDRVDSPTATSLPVRLAVSLLKDRDGNINLDLPISGSLSDPQFSVGGLIVRVFVNLIVKAVTSPFALIGSMFNSSENIGDLQYIEFSPGSSEVTADVRKKLDALGYALHERPGIKLDITGRVDPKVDDQGLRLEALNRQMRALKRKDTIEKEAQPSGRIQITDAERPKYLERVYKDAKFDKPRNVVGFAKSLPPEEMQKLIMEHTEVTQDDLRNLAQQRADQIRTYLQEQSIIEPARIFLIAPKLNADGIKPNEPTARVDLTIQ